MRSCSRIVALAAPVVVGTVLLTAAPAYAASGYTGYTACLRTSSSDTYATYATADSWSQRVSAVADRVVLNADGVGRTYDCGPAGRAQSVQGMRVSVFYDVDGQSLNCSVGGSSDGTVTTNCSVDRARLTVKDEYTCQQWTSVCSVTDRNMAFTSNGGRINNIWVTVRVTIFGPSGSASTGSDHDAY
jgi:hypothetical protein